MAKTVKLKFDGVTEECLVRTDANGEILCITRDNRVIKFPKGSDLKEEVKRHNADRSNADIPVPAVDADEAAQQDAELTEWLGGDAQASSGADEE